MKLEIKDLYVRLQKENILKDISFGIEDGSFVSLLGESGCGKTTLLKSIAGLLDIERGDILLDGDSLLPVRPQDRGTVIVFQDLRLFPHMSVEKNICFSMELKKIPKKEQKRRVRELLADEYLVDTVEDGEQALRRLREEGHSMAALLLDGGQMQRVALARAFAADPKILLLDEPFSGLDEKLRVEMGALVKRLQREKHVTTVLVTHDKKEALQLSDKIALMHQGEIIQHADARELLCKPCSPAVSEYFGRSAYVTGEVKDGVFAGEGYRFACGEADGRYDVMMLLDANVCCFKSRERGLQYGKEDRV